MSILAYDLRSISSESEGGPRIEVEDQRGMLGGDTPSQICSLGGGSTLSEHDRELRKFPLALTSKMFFFFGCAMYLWIAVDDLKWAHEARTIPDSVLDADDDATWRQFRSRQRSGIAKSSAASSNTNTESSNIVTTRSDSQGYSRSSSTVQDTIIDEDELTWSEFRNTDDNGRNMRRYVRNRRNLVDDLGLHTQWSELPFAKQIAAATLGYDEISWNSGGTTFTDTLPWESLSEDQQNAALILGYTQYLWDMLRGFQQPRSQENGVDPSSQDWGAYFWSELPEEIRAEAAKLGYGESIWNNGERTYTDDLFWDQLSPEQQQAATTLGYTQSTWDVYSDESILPAASTTTTTTMTAATTSPAGSPGSANREPNTSSSQSPASASTYTATSSPTTSSATSSPTTASSATSSETKISFASTGTSGSNADTTTSSGASNTGSSGGFGTATAAPTTSNGNWRTFQWADLPAEIQGGAIALGYTESLWNSGAPISTDKYFWDDLSDSQKKAATAIFGFTETTWNASNGKWQTKAWHELPSDIRAYATVLGYEEELWNAAATIDTESYTWDELSGEQQQAAFVVFGYTDQTWDGARTDNENKSIKNSGGGRGGGRGGADDDYVFNVERKSGDVWVSKYQIVYFVASICFLVVGILDIIRERRPYHILMVFAGSFGILASMWVETNLTASNIFNCFSTHFFVFQSITTFFHRTQLRALLSGPFKNAIWTADISFTVGALLEAILSYFYFKDGSRENLSIARTDSFAALLFFFSSAIYLVTTPLIFMRNTKEKPYR